MPAAARNRYADLLRVCAIGGVVYGHWLLTSITYARGQLSGVDALAYVSWARWVTLLFQVMPVFFLVGGYANAVSWTAHHARGESWTAWVRGRAMRLLWPATVYVMVAELAAAGAKAAGAGPAELAHAGWLTALQLWFLPVYLLLIVLTPAMLAAHRRWRAAVPAVMALGAAGVDVAVLGPRLPLIGFANYLLVWGSMHQWGFAWQDGSLTRYRWRPWLLAGGGAGLFALLVTVGPFPVDMIGAGERIGNTSPPSLALLAFAAAQAGLLLAAWPAASRLLARPRWWRTVSRLNARVMTVYLWHMVPVIVVAVIVYPARMVPQPAVGSALWWALRPAWFAALTVVLVLLTVVITWAEQPLRLLPSGFGPTGSWSPVILTAGVAAVMTGLTRLAIAGFAPAGGLPVRVLALYAAGLLLILLSGRAPPAAVGAAEREAGVTSPGAEVLGPDVAGAGPPRYPGSGPGRSAELARCAATRCSRSSRRLSSCRLLWALQGPDPALAPGQPVWVVAQDGLGGAGDGGDGVAGARARRGQQYQAGVRSSLREELGGERAEVLDVVGDDGPVFAAGRLEDGAVAAPGEVVAVGDGFDVVPGLAQELGDLRGQLLVQDGLHERRACSPAAAAARPRSYSASLSSISLSISLRCSP